MEISNDHDHDDELVWHYTDGPGLISILSGHALWATSSAFLNDAQEVALGVGRLAERLHDLALDEPAYRLILDGLNPLNAGIATPLRCYILSASRTGDSLAMWRLYGGTQESYAIGLDPNVRLSVLSDGVRFDDEGLARAGVYLKRMRWEPVRYSASSQAELIEAVVDDLPTQIQELRAAAATVKDSDGLLLPAHTWALLRSLLDDIEQALVLIKHEGFVDEREVRQAVVMHARDEHTEAVDLEAHLLSYRATDYGIAPYLRLTGSGEGDVVVDAPSPLPIRSIAISPSPTGGVAEQSLERLLHAHGYRDVSVLRSAIPFRS